MTDSCSGNSEESKTGGGRRRGRWWVRGRIHGGARQNTGKKGESEPRRRRESKTERGRAKERGQRNARERDKKLAGGMKEGERETGI